MRSELIFLDPHPRTEAMVYTPDVERFLASQGRVVAHFGSRAPDSLVEEILPEVSILIGQTAMPKERLDRAPRLRGIINVKGNWEPDLDYVEAESRGIHVLSAAPAMAPAVAEYCLSQAISVARDLSTADSRFRCGQEQYGIAGNARAYSLFGADVGLVGFGNLGRALVPLLEPFGCTIAAFDPWVDADQFASHGIRCCTLSQVLSQSRFLFLLAGVTTENQGFLDSGKLGLIMEDATVVLASRAEIVEFDAFLEFAARGRFRAVVDVFPEEPVPAHSQIRSVPNVVFSSHLAGGTRISYQLIREMMIKDVSLLLAGQPPVHLQRAIPSQAARMRSR